MTIGEKIKYLRKREGLTQTELGAKLGVKTNAVSKWECGRVEAIPTSKIKAMAYLFGVPPSYLIDDTAPAYPFDPDIAYSYDPDLEVMSSIALPDPAADETSFSYEEQNIILAYRSLNPEGQQMLLDYLVGYLCQTDKYIKTESHQSGGVAEGA